MGHATGGQLEGSESRAKTAHRLAILAVVLYVVAMIVAQEKNEWLWPVSGVVGAVAAIMGWSAGKPRPRGQALAAVIMGGLIFLSILGWIVWALATGNM